MPPRIAWMAMHFSVSGPGLSSRPHRLPPGSLILLDDQTPWNGHSLEAVCQETTDVLLCAPALPAFCWTLSGRLPRRPPAWPNVSSNAARRQAVPLGCPGLPRIRRRLPSSSPHFPATAPRNRRWRRITGVKSGWKPPLADARSPWGRTDLPSPRQTPATWRQSPNGSSHLPTHTYAAVTLATQQTVGCNWLSMIQRKPLQRARPLSGPGRHPGNRNLAAAGILTARNITEKRHLGEPKCRFSSTQEERQNQ